MRGKFIGSSSLGFEHGKIYSLRSDIKIVRKGGPIFGETIPCFCIIDMDNPKNWCPYQSLEAVLKNWEFIKGE